jgi:hypothetical protein
MDLTLDYKPMGETFKGLWFRLRGAFLDQDGRDSEGLKEVRFIVNYDLPIT